MQPGDVVFAYASHRSGHVLSEQALIKLPAGVDPEAAIFLANLNTTFNGILDADLHLGETVVVFGQGVLGQLVVQEAKLSGVSQADSRGPGGQAAGTLSASQRRGRHIEPDAS